MKQKVVNKKYINLVDLLLIVSIILCILFAVNVIMSDIITGTLHEIEYVIKISQADFISKSALKPGYSVILNDSETNMGIITNVIFKPSLHTEFDYMTDKFSTVEIIGRYDVYVTVNATAVLKNNIYRIDEMEIIANTSPQIKFPFIFDKSEIVSVTRRDSDAFGG